jgi:ribosomal protein S30
MQFITKEKEREEIRPRVKNLHRYKNRCMSPDTL